MSKIRVAVLRGGPSHAYEESLKTGAYVLSLLREMPEKYEPIDIFIDREGNWHYGGVSNEPHQILSDVDTVWNSLHGSYGESGEAQKLLESLRIPFTGSGAVAAALAHDKSRAKKLYRQHSLTTPASTTLTLADMDEARLIKIFQTYLHPVVVKPATGVRGLGVRLAHTFQELKDAIKKTFAHSPKVMVEEYVRGGVSTCVVIEGAKGERLYTLIPSGRQPTEVNKQIEEMAKQAHEALGQRHYSAHDFITTPRGQVYILETNSLPLFHEDSLLHHSLHSTGWQPKDFCEHCLKLSLNRVDPTGFEPVTSSLQMRRSTN